jgi:hypothetical protein
LDPGTQPPYTTGSVLYFATVMSIWLRRPDQVENTARQALRQAEELSFPVWHAWGRIHLGWALSQRGLARGLDEIEAGLRECQRLGVGMFEPFYLSIAAHEYSRAGRHGEVRASIRKAFESLTHRRDLAFRYVPEKGAPTDLFYRGQVILGAYQCSPYFPGQIVFPFGS